MTQVQSSNVEEVGYDADQSELYVRFASGETYVYLNVDPSLYEGLLSAGSVGRYLNINVNRATNTAGSRLVHSRTEVGP